MYVCIRVFSYTCVCVCVCVCIITGYKRLKARRGICNPNPGFCSQLVRWGRRLIQACHVSPDTQLQVCVCVCVYIYMHVSVSVWCHVSPDTQLLVFVYVNVCVCVCVCVCVFMYINLAMCGRRHRSRHQFSKDFLYCLYPATVIGRSRFRVAAARRAALPCRLVWKIHCGNSLW
jgi:hypothetical protein